MTTLGVIYLEDIMDRFIYLKHDFQWVMAHLLVLSSHGQSDNGCVFF